MMKVKSLKEKRFQLTDSSLTKIYLRNTNGPRSQIFSASRDGSIFNALNTGTPRTPTVPPKMLVPGFQTCRNISTSFQRKVMWKIELVYVEKSYVGPLAVLSDQ